MASPFKPYDVRAPYGPELSIPFAYNFGRAYATFLGGAGKTIVVGRDARWHSEPLFTSLANGILDQGFNVVDIGHVSTCMTYHANGKWKADGSIMITASHNSAKWNGFKPCRAGAVPISGDSGLQDIEKIILNESYAPKAEKRGTLATREIIPEYTKFIRSFKKPAKKLRVAVDYANGMGVVEAQALEGLVDIVKPLYDTIDGRFPNHEADPIRHENLRDLQVKIVTSGGYDFGAAFDGDGDRVGFVDELGGIIPMDIITALIAEDILKTRKGAVILHDLRSSWVVAETIKKNHGKPGRCRVGHSLIKELMRKKKAVFAGELSGHYYFADNYTTESSALAVLCVARIIARSGKTLSELVKPLRSKYFKTPEINSDVKDTQIVFKKIKELYPKFDEFDGISVKTPNWWFNIRCSNTEPKIRLNLEAKTEKLMKEMRDKLLAIIRKDYA